MTDMDGSRRPDRDSEIERALNRDSVLGGRLRGLRDWHRRLEADAGIDHSPHSSASPTGKAAETRRLGEYQVIRKIGEGGMGVVYEAWQDSMDRRVALKILPPRAVAESSKVARFVREAKVAGKLTHPNIVSVHGLGFENSTPYYVMEFVAGRTLEEALGSIPSSGTSRPLDSDDLSELSALFGPAHSPDSARLPSHESLRPMEDTSTSTSDDYASTRNPLDLNYCLTLARAFASVADGLQHAHERGVCHRDIKPSNLIIDLEGRLRILDFGLAYAEGDEGLTATGDLLGTPLYMSPEQVLARRATIDHRTDIYSLGATFFTMLTRTPPFRGRTLQETTSQILHKDPPSLRGLQPRIPRDLETIVLKCLRKRPSDRYGTAEALAQDLRRFVRGDPIEARPQPSWERLARRLWQRRSAVGLGILSCSLLFLLGIVWAENRKANHKARVAQYQALVRDGVMRLGLARFTRPDDRYQTTRIAPEALIGDAKYDKTAASLHARPLEEALQYFIQAEALIPERPEAPFYHAHSLLMRGRTAEAIAQAQGAFNRFPDFLPLRDIESTIPETTPDSNSRGSFHESNEVSSAWDVASRMARQAEKQERWADAVEAYTQLVELHRTDRSPYFGLPLEAYLGRGFAHLQLNSPAQAIADFGAAAALWPDAIEPSLLVGKAQCQAGAFDAAEETFHRLYARHPEESDIVALWVAAIYKSFKRYEDGLGWIKKIGLERMQVRGTVDLLNNLRRFDDALAVGIPALQRFPDDGRLFYIVGLSIFFSRKGPNLLEIAERAVRLEPSKLSYHLLANANWRNGHLGATITAFRKAIELSSADPVPVTIADFGYCLWTLGRLQEAESRLREAVRRCRQRPTHTALAFRGLGGVLFDQGEISEAESYLREGVSYHPSDPSVRRALIGLLWYSGQHAATLDALQAYVDEFPRDPGALSWAALRLHLLGNSDQAVTLFGKALEADGTHAKTLERLFQLLQYPAIPITDGHTAKLRDALLTKAPQDQPGRKYWEAAAALHSDPSSPREALVFLEYSRRAVQSSDAPSARAVRLLAEAQLMNDLKHSALESFERLQHLSGDPNTFLALERLRKSLLPEIASYASVDWLLERDECLVDMNEGWLFWPDASTLPTDWQSPELDDSSWAILEREGRRNGSSTLVTFPITRYSSPVHLRRRFRLDQPERIEALELTVQTDGGVVVYLNGQLIASWNAGVRGQLREGEGHAEFDRSALLGRLLPRPPAGARFGIDPAALRTGDNVLAVRGLRQELLPDAFLLAVRLSAQRQPLVEDLPGLSIAAVEDARGRTPPHLVEYVRARSAQVRGDVGSAIRSFRALSARRPSDREPLFRLVDCLRGSDRADLAEAHLREALNSDWGKSRDVWNKWFTVCALDLGWSASRILQALRSVDLKPDPPPEPDGPLVGMRESLSRALSSLASTSAIRINCGGRQYVDTDATVWHADIFYHKGSARNRTIDVAGTELDPLYHSMRSFSWPSPGPGYRVPLPPGTYRLRVHFCETVWSFRADRMDVVAEGKPLLVDFEPAAPGLCTATVRQFEIAVDDGVLDLEFRVRTGRASVAAIEIVPLGSHSAD